MDKNKAKQIIDLQNKIEVLNGILRAYETKSKLLDIVIGNWNFSVDYDVAEIIINTLKNLKDVYKFELEEL